MNLVKILQLDCQNMVSIHKHVMPIYISPPTHVNLLKWCLVFVKKSAFIWAFLIRQGKLFVIWSKYYIAKKAQEIGKIYRKPHEFKERLQVEATS